MITLYYTDLQGNHQPINYRLYDKSERKTKNDYFLEMLAEVLAWGVLPSFVTMDSWYSCVKNLKAITNHRMGFLAALESNRLVSIEKGSWVQLRNLEIPEDGIIVWLREFGFVKVFRTYLKDQMRHYAVFLSQNNDTPSNDQDKNDVLTVFSKTEFTVLHDKHWQIEQFHRTIKQVCNIENFQVRNETAVKNHIFAAICGYVKLQTMRATEVIANCYQLQRELFNQVITGFINSFIPSMSHLNSQYSGVVNA